MNAPSTELLPGAGVVDVWSIALDVPEDVRERLLTCLDDDERRHAARMRTGGERWAVARAMRREILSRCCGIAAKALRFEVDANGKPRLAGSPGVHLNTSSRDAWALLAISSSGPVGVDLERVDVPGDLIEVARRFLPAEEVAAIEATAPDRRARRFAIAWTRYEAARKLSGLGIDDATPEADRVTTATVRELEAPAGFVAAVAAENAGWTARLRDASELTLGL